MFRYLTTLFFSHHTNSLPSFVYLSDGTFLLHMIYLHPRRDSGPDIAVEASKAFGRSQRNALTQGIQPSPI